MLQFDLFSSYSGQLVSLDEMLALLKNAIDKKTATSKGFLIDGFPREVCSSI
jgi:adenylate kinase family enzyme